MQETHNVSDKSEFQVCIIPDIDLASFALQYGEIAIFRIDQFERVNTTELRFQRSFKHFLTFDRYLSLFNKTERLKYNFCTFYSKFVC